MLADLHRTPQRFQDVRVVLTGSYWKYYRRPNSPPSTLTRGWRGIFRQRRARVSTAARAVLRSARVRDPNPMASNRGRPAQLDELNRRWFFQQSEDVFRNRTFQLVRKKATACASLRGRASHSRSRPGHDLQQPAHDALGRARRFREVVAVLWTKPLPVRRTPAPGPRVITIHWSSLGPFRSLADPEKQFLILKSLLLMGGQGGGILVDESEWFALSTNFRSRVEAFAKSIVHGDLKLRSRVLYLAPHLWSSAGTLWPELLARVGAGSRMISSLALLNAERDASLLIVDPAWILTRESIQAIASLGQRGPCGGSP